MLLKKGSICRNVSEREAEGFLARGYAEIQPEPENAEIQPEPEEKTAAPKKRRVKIGGEAANS